MKKRVFVDAEELVKQLTENYSRGFRIPTITEQEIVKPYLDGIRAEIEAIIEYNNHNLDDYDFCSGLIRARNIIDKYRKEQI